MSPPLWFIYVKTAIIPIAENIASQKREQEVGSKKQEAGKNMCMEKEKKSEIFTNQSLIIAAEIIIQDQLSILEHRQKTQIIRCNYLGVNLVLV